MAAHGDGEERQEGNAVRRRVVDDVLAVAGRLLVFVMARTLWADIDERFKPM
ncbi:hypothetical protein [Streptomyces sp. Tu102]|uniref:hypothetical protein n=1 Tax=Streptomyces sp. Tu102 TaxID=2838019 RepID=UPI001BDBCB62|nr:hypothetical protein [Streptomyces sp. Tu102]MBT1094090.1 hypothetical protein [Streptomyces sp. Tu102]